VREAVRTFEEVINGGACGAVRGAAAGCGHVISVAEGLYVVPLFDVGDEVKLLDDFLGCPLVYRSWVLAGFAMV
jgi:hypothetical protein